MILDYPGGPDVITGSLLKGGRGSAWVLGDVVCKQEAGVIRENHQQIQTSWCLEAGKGKEIDSPLKLLEEMQAS